MQAVKHVYVYMLCIYINTAIMITINDRSSDSTPRKTEVVKDLLTGACPGCALPLTHSLLGWVPVLRDPTQDKGV